jgi:hypothetical protein
MVVVKPSNEPLLVMHGTEAVVAWKEGNTIARKNFNSRNVTLDRLPRRMASVVGDNCAGVTEIDASTREFPASNDRILMSTQSSRKMDARQGALTINVFATQPLQPLTTKFLSVSD